LQEEDILAPIGSEVID